MPTRAHDAITKNLTRAAYFLDLHEGTQQGPGTPDLKRRELPRGAVVFAVGALDAYLSEVSAEVMLAQFEHGRLSGENRDVLKEVLRNSPTLALEAALAAEGVDRRELVSGAITDHFYNQVSNHGSKAVAAATQRMGGSVQRVWQRVIDVGITNPAGELDEWTDKRHQIVHQGQVPRVRRDSARECVLLIGEIAHSVDDEAMAILTA